LAELAARQNAALYIAHTHAALPSAAQAASRTGAKLAFDAEDLLAESSAEPVQVMRAIEQFYVPHCALITTMSRVAADRLRQLLKLPATPLVLHNAPWLKEREGLVPPERRPGSEMLSIYWFGQTVGPHSCADQLLRALPLLVRPAKLVLRGRPNAGYIAELRRLALDLGVSDQLEVCPRALPGEMVRLAGEHDVSVGSQPSAEPFHQMAIGNKVFTGLMAGTLVALTDTVAHRSLAQELGESAVLFPNKDGRELAQRLNQITASEDKLLAAKRTAWRLAEERFNWERESEKLVEGVEELIGKP
jgi:glycosyltransferase involved in cell wall biosynthesis